MRMQISKALVIGILLSFVRFPFMPQAALRIFKLVVVVSAMAYILYLKGAKSASIRFIILYALSVVLSSFLGYGWGNQFAFGVVYGLLLIELFILTGYWVKTFGIRDLKAKVFLYLSALCLLNDLLLFLNIKFDTYTVGNKFGVAYYHLLLLAFFSMVMERDSYSSGYKLIKNISVAVLGAYCVYIARLVDTNTGLVGIIVFMALYYLPDWFKRIMANPKAALITMYGLSATILVWDWILGFKIVQDIIVNVMHRTLTLTGRLRIYRILYPIFMRHPLFGWGYETEIVRENLYGNAQNGVVHLAIQYGVIGVIVFTFLVYDVFKHIRFYHREEYVIIAALYAFFVMATVEIVFSKTFFILLALCYALGSADEKNRRGAKKKWFHMRRRKLKRIRIKI